MRPPLFFDADAGRCFSHRRSGSDIWTTKPRRRVLIKNVRGQTGCQRPVQPKLSSSNQVFSGIVRVGLRLEG